MRLEHDEFTCPIPGHQPVADDLDDLRLNAAQELSRKIAASGLQNDAFLLANEDQLVANCTQWAQAFPNIQPYFDVSCNTCPWLLEALCHMNFKFACQSKIEIQHVLAQGIDASKIYFANPNKIASHMKFASANKVPLMAFGSFNELKKIQKSLGAAVNPIGLLLYLNCPTGNPETDREWLDLLNAAKDLGLNVMGVSFQEGHEGHFNKMMALARMAFSIGHSLGHPMNIVNVGTLAKNLDKDVFDNTIIQHLGGLKDFQVIAHFGSAFVQNVFTCGAKIIGKRVGYQQNSLVINDGIFKSFGRLLVDDEHTIDNVKALKDNKAAMKVNKQLTFDVFGSSGDDLDVLVQELVLGQDVDEDDWLFFANMGAYSIGINSNMKSIKLPSKFGNFRLFTPDLAKDDEDPDATHQTLNIEEILMLSPTSQGLDGLDEGLEVVFLDIQGMTNEQQTCLDLFEELPSLGYDTEAKFLR